MNIAIHDIRHLTVDVILFAFIAALSLQGQTYTIVHSFQSGTDGEWPAQGVIRDSAGNLYGTTLNGGPHAGGAVYKLDAAGNATVLYGFNGVGTGYLPANLLRDPTGNLYGMTAMGGRGCVGLGCGLIYKLDPAGNESVLYRFAGTSDGAGPQAGLITDQAGNLYGTTADGGAMGL